MEQFPNPATAKFKSGHWASNPATTCIGSAGNERWQAFTGGKAKLESDGRAFSAVAAERRPESPGHLSGIVASGRVDNSVRPRRAAEKREPLV
jgi:hypothetical protein